jgi:hypothetical protein
VEPLFGTLNSALPGHFTIDSPILALLREPVYEIAPQPSVETYRGVVDQRPSVPRSHRDLQAIVIGTRQTEEYGRLHCLDIREPTPREVWHVDVENENVCARFQQFTIAQHPDGRLFAFDTESGKTVWHERCASALFARPTLVGDTVVRCGLTDGRIIDVDLRALRTVAQHSPRDAGALRAGTALPPINVHRRTKLSHGGIDYWLRGTALWSSTARVTEVGEYRPSQFVAAAGADILVGLRREERAEHALAVGFLDGATLQPRAVVEIGSSDTPAFDTVARVDDYFVIAASTLTERGRKIPSTTIVDMRTASIAARLVDHRAAALSEGWDADGRSFFRGKI